MSSPTDIWQVEVQGQIYEADLSELKQWVSEGAVLPSDRVRHGNLRWIPAKKVPALDSFFNLNEAEAADSPNGTTKGSAAPPETIESGQVAGTRKESDAKRNIFTDEKLSHKPIFKIGFSPTEIAPEETEVINVCTIHPEKEAAYACDVCENRYCKICPRTYGGVKICPECGSLCRAADAEPKKSVGAVYKPYQRTDERLNSDRMTGRFGFEDIGDALALPLKYQKSFFLGGALYVVLTLVQNAAPMKDGILTLGAAIVCAMLANILVFGCLTRTIGNFSEGEFERNFMPRIEDFNLRNDVVRPFFLSIGAYIVSFGLLIALMAAFFFWFAPIQSALMFDAESNVLTQTSESFSAVSLSFLILGGALALWGVFYFPAAVAVAAYTRSLSATLNPLVGIDTILRLGFDYAKILAVFVVLGAASFLVASALKTIFAPLDLPILGNLPAQAVSGFFNFYLIVVFGAALGFALCRNSQRLNLFR